MYCIINQTKDIIAADKEFFSLLKSANLIELYRQIASGAIDIAFEEDKVTIANLGDVRFYRIENFEISGLLSQSKIVKILPEIPKNEIKTDTDMMVESFSEQKEELLQDNELKTEAILSDIIYDESQKNQDKPENKAQDETTYIKIEPQESAAYVEIQPQESTDANTNAKIEPQENATAYDTAKINFESSAIDLDTHAISQKMGLSKTDYITFLKEYIQTVKSLRKDLESNNKDIQKSAVNFIVHLSDVLHLPENISNLVASLNSSATQKNIDDFYNAIEQISTDNEDMVSDINDTDEKQEAIEPITLDVNDTNEKQEAIEPTQSETNDTTNKVENENLGQQPAGSIDLSNITPIKFDFTLDETANALSLPNDIVKDFIKDFIEQCHTEAANFIDAYEKSDIERIKKTARLLKGVASNLYISPLAQSLLELQYNDDIKQAEPLIKKFWAQFVAFEELMKNE